jgi:hypothetical protein
MGVPRASVVQCFIHLLVKLVVEPGESPGEGLNAPLAEAACTVRTRSPASMITHRAFGFAWGGHDL